MQLNVRRRRESQVGTFFASSSIRPANLRAQKKTRLGPSASALTEVPPDTWQLFRPRAHHRIENVGLVSNVRGRSHEWASSSYPRYLLSPAALLATLRSASPLSADASPVEETSSPPVRSTTSLARLISSDVSQCTERRIPPFLRRPS